MHKLLITMDSARVWLSDLWHLLATRARRAKRRFADKAPEIAMLVLSLCSVALVCAQANELAGLSPGYWFATALMAYKALTMTYESALRCGLPATGPVFGFLAWLMGPGCRLLDYLVGITKAYIRKRDRIRNEKKSRMLDHYDDIINGRSSQPLSSVGPKFWRYVSVPTFIRRYHRELL